MSPAAPDSIHFQGSDCEGCGKAFPANTLDDDDLCETCRPIMKRRLRRGRHLIAALVTLPFAIWVLTLDRGATLAQPVWILPLAGAYYLGLRIGGEVVRGYARWNKTRRRPE
jgi:predicted nucleic acid-binding Zn ribbon protein